MNSQPRNRIVVFRLTQDEYRALKDACDRRGARNISDFTRSEILDNLHPGVVHTTLAQRFSSLEEKLDMLQSRLFDLFQGGSGVNQKQ